MCHYKKLKLLNMVTAIIGSRNITAFDLSKVVPSDTTVIVSGGATGVDTLAARYARAKRLPLVEFKPNYREFGKGAPFVRNRQIIDYCDNVVAVWDGVSKGTKYTVDYARKQGKKVKLIVVDTCETQNIFANQTIVHCL